MIYHVTETTHPPLELPHPIAVVGAGPVGLLTALGLAHYGIPFCLFEEDDRTSIDTKAGTTLARTLEIFRRYGVADRVLERALRVDEIGEIDRASGRARLSVKLHVLAEDTRYPFVVNLPQHHFEPVLADAVRSSPLGELRLSHRLRRFDDAGDGVRLTFDSPRGEQSFETPFLLACDGGRSVVREQLGATVEGESLPERYSLVDLDVDLDVANRRDYPYLAYFSDPQEWMILVRQPHCWRFLFPVPPDREEPSAEALREKVLTFIGAASNVRILGTNAFRVHHRVASRWREGRVFLMGDAAHLITPMWALGWNTGALDASNLPWRLAWWLRGWAAESILDGYEREQKPVALRGSGEMAEAARRNMSRQGDGASAMTDNNWGNAYTRTLLGVRLDVDGSGDWSMVKTETAPPVRAGDRIPDGTLHGPDGRPLRVHDLVSDRFAALYVTDVRQRPALPANGSPALSHHIVSRWDAPFDSGLRDRALLDPGGRFERRLGCAPDTVLLVRPDEHIAAIAPMSPGAAERLYRAVVGKDAP
jgi:3-(3-hydroxy-phenyl)propionate hydroxylase